MSFLINVSATDDYKDVAAKIDSIEGTAVGELNFSMEELLHHGIYIFKENGNVAYVGKATSRIFLERFAGHFDPRKDGGFNNALRSVAKAKKLSPDSDEDLKKAWEIALKFKVVCIKLESKNNKDIADLEKQLINHYNKWFPLYNKTVWDLFHNYKVNAGDVIKVKLKDGSIRQFKVESASPRFGFIYGRFYTTRNILSKAVRPQSIHKDQIQ